MTDTEDIVGALEDLGAALKRLRLPNVYVNPTAAPAVHVDPTRVTVAAPAVTVQSQHRTFTVRVTKRDSEGFIKELTITPD